MIKKLHTNSIIFFENPIVIYVSRSDNMPEDIILREYSLFCRKLSRQLSTTWGHSRVSTTYNFTSMASISESYFCFSDEESVLQFRLMLPWSAKNVKIWPHKTAFTIHEYKAE